MPANVNSMAWIGQVGDAPWWIGTEEDYGQAVHAGDRGLKAGEMLQLAGLDWGIQCAPMRAQLKIDGQRRSVTVPNHHAIVREDTLDVLGVRTKRFEPVLNVDSFAFFDEVIGNGAYCETAGAIGLGEKVWLMARIPEQDILVAGLDPIYCYLLLVNTHGGSASTSFQMMFAPIRTVCENTLNISITRGETHALSTGSGRYRLPHLRGINNRLNADDARAALGLAKEYMTSFKETADRLAETPMSEKELEAFLQRVIPYPTHLLLEEPKGNKPLALLKEPDPEMLAPNYAWMGSSFPKNREKVRTLVEHGAGQDVDDKIGSKVNGTRWAAFQGVAEYTDYVAGWESARTSNLLFGEGQTMKQRAWNVLTADFK